MPELTLLGKASAANVVKADGGEADIEESEFVEQEGCPEDTDFNRWSHHTGVGTCEDELLQHSLGDSAAVSFVFGLEVNWSLLESREAQYREENELRKEQQRLDLEALNEQRRLKREGLLNPRNSSGSKDKKVKKDKNDKKTQGGDPSDSSDSDGSEDQGGDDQQEGETTTAKSSSASKKRKSGPPDVERNDTDDDGATPKKLKKKPFTAAATATDTAGEKKKDKEKKRKRIDGGDGVGDGDGNEGAAMRDDSTTAVTSSVKKAKTRTPPMPVDQVVIANAKSAAAASSSRRTSSAGTSHALDPLQEIDHTFQADWEFLRRAHSKGKIKTFTDFQLVMKQLKIFNNNWRVIPADYTNINTPTMYTRIPGLKSDTCVNYKEGYDYFVGDAALMRFMYMQASFLGDGGLVHDALKALDEQEKQRHDPEGAPLPTSVTDVVPAVGREKTSAQRASKKKIICDSDSEIEEDQIANVEEKFNSAAAAAPAFVPMTSSVSKKLFTPAVRADEIDFGDTEDDDNEEEEEEVVRVHRRDSKFDKPQPAKIVAQASKSELKSPVAKDTRKPARRVIADSDDEERGDENDREGGDDGVREKNARKVERIERGSASKTPKAGHIKASSNSSNNKDVEVLDLTSLTQSSPAVVLETSSRKQKQQHKGSTSPLVASVPVPVSVYVPVPVPAPVSALVATPSTIATAPVRNTLSILNAAITSRPAYKGQENLPPNVRSSVPASAPSLSAAAATASGSSASSTLSSSIGVAKDREREATRDTARSGPQDDNRGHSAGSAGSSDSGSADGEGDTGSSTWTCSFCTLLNNVTDAPTDCSLCGYAFVT